MGSTVEWQKVEACGHWLFATKCNFGRWFRDNFVKIGRVIVIFAALASFPARCEAEANPNYQRYGQNKCLPFEPNWLPQGSQFGELMWFNALNVKPTGLTWNEHRVSEISFQQKIAKAGRMPFGGFVFIVDLSAPCTKVDALRRIITRTLKCGAHRICVEYSTPEWEETRLPSSPKIGR